MAGYVKATGLLQVQNHGNSSWVKIPLTYIKIEEYQVTPDQMLDLDSYRAETGVLLRPNVLSHTATKVEFNTPHIYRPDLNALLKIIKDGYIDSKAHDLQLKYYDQYTDAYKTGHFYVPDIQFTINHINENTGEILYNPVRIAFIEY